MLGVIRQVARGVSAACAMLLLAAFVPMHVDAAPLPAPPTVSAKAAILMEAGTGKVLYAKNERERRAMASTTKIMTTLLTLESYGLDEPFTVDANAIKVEGSSMGLVEGDIVTKRALCYGMLLPSGNDAAGAGAVAVAGSVEAFVQMMNDRAKEMGLNDTSFVTPSGLDADAHYSTAYDMALLAREALRNPDFAAICASQSAKVEFGSPPAARWLRNSNKMLSSYSGAIGVKTGFTDKAGRCLVSAAERNGVRLICVTLFDRDDWRDHTALLDYGFATVQSVAISYDFSALKVNVVGGTDKNRALSIVPHQEPRACIEEAQLPNVTARVSLPQFVYAPVGSGALVGSIDFLLDNNVVFSTALVTTDSEDAHVSPPKPTIFDKMQSFFEGLFNKDETEK